MININFSLFFYFEFEENTLIHTNVYESNSFKPELVS